MHAAQAAKASCQHANAKNAHPKPEARGAEAFCIIMFSKNHACNFNSVLTYWLVAGQKANGEKDEQFEAVPVEESPCHEEKKGTVEQAKDKDEKEKKRKRDTGEEKPCGIGEEMEEEKDKDGLNKASLEGSMGATPQDKLQVACKV